MQHVSAGSLVQKNLGVVWVRGFMSWRRMQLWRTCDTCTCMMWLLVTVNFWLHDWFWDVPNVLVAVCIMCSGPGPCLLGTRVFPGGELYRLTLLNFIAWPKRHGLIIVVSKWLRKCTFPLHVCQTSLHGLSQEHSHKRNNEKEGENSSQTCNDRFLGFQRSV